MNIDKQNVIVLKQQLLGESDLIIYVLNSKGGLISLIAKGAIKSQKRFTGGVLEPGNFIGIEYKNSRNSSLCFLQQAWFIKRFNGLRKDYDRLKLAFYFLSLVKKVSQEGVKDSSNLFNLLGNSLISLETSNNLLALKFLFEYRLLLIQGVLSKELQQQVALNNIIISEHEQLSECMHIVQSLTFKVKTEVNKYIER